MRTALRRSFLSGSFLSGGWAWLARVMPGGAAASLGASSASAAARVSVYETLGIPTILNFRGTHTTIGASKQWPDLHDAMADAARQFVSLDELQDKIGERISKLAGTESAMVTTGAAGAICVGTCACVAGSDTGAIRRLPDTTGLKNEVVVLKQHRNGYDHAVRNVGVRMIDVDGEAELRAAINPRTAMMYFLGGTSGDSEKPATLAVEQVLRITRPAGVPVLVDAANMLPPWDNVRRLAAAGVDLICTSGGKHIRGPQCSGLLAGRKDLVAAARLNMSPHSDSLGRPMKVGREEMVGLWLAVEKYAKLDFDALDRECMKQAEFLRGRFAKLPGVKSGFEPVDRTRNVRRVFATWDESALGMTAAQVEKRLWEGTPRIGVLRHQPQGVTFVCFMNDAGDEKQAAVRMEEIFGRKA
ncbi:MAG: PLP-dependent transferase [Acidobacteria bacterium]|nr:PLP-dependent transferase [Acidobacteriota bacterium]